MTGMNTGYAVAQFGPGDAAYKSSLRKEPEEKAMNKGTGDAANLIGNPVIISSVLFYTFVHSMSPPVLIVFWSIQLYRTRWYSCCFYARYY